MTSDNLFDKKVKSMPSSLLNKYGDGETKKGL